MPAKAWPPHYPPSLAKIMRVLEATRKGSAKIPCDTPGAALAIEHIHTYLVHPRRTTEEKSKITGTQVPLKGGGLYDMLQGVYDKSDKECDIDIAFNRAADGRQKNECRDLVLAYLKAPSVGSGRPLAVRLEQFTAKTSGHGLLFLIAGKESGETKLILSRFPADNGILAEEDQTSLSVEFLERIFMKSAFSYKAALYKDTSLTAGFWAGRCVDKQINDPARRVSDYWIQLFLASSLRVTSAAGTHRLAAALRDAIRVAPNLGLKQEITAAVTLAQGLKGQRLSVIEFGERFGLSPDAKKLIAKQLKDPALATERFQFNWVEFSTQLAYRAVEMDNGAVITAEASQFNDVVHREDLKAGKVRLSVEGKIQNEKLKKAP